MPIRVRIHNPGVQVADPADTKSYSDRATTTQLSRKSVLSAQIRLHPCPIAMECDALRLCASAPLR